MFVLTAKMSKTKIAAIVTAVIALVVILVIAISAGSNAVQSSAVNADTNDARIRFLANYGWDVNAEPVQTQDVTIPADAGDEVFCRYNDLQKSQGYDLAQYAGQTVQRYVYEILNYPNASEPVYATILVRNGCVIGGDITNTASGGKVHGFVLPQSCAE